jgi:hypothetical protein
MLKILSKRLKLLRNYEFVVIFVAKNKSSANFYFQELILIFYR